MTEPTVPFAAWASAEISRLEVRNAELEAKNGRLRAERDAERDRAELWKTAKLDEALEESVKMQSHYAALLNDYDGGKRIVFASADEWLKRLATLKAVNSTR